MSEYKHYRKATLGIDRKKMYKLPWTKTDNPGGWVEVTDECDLFCPGCYRHKLEGHRSLKEVKEDILACQKMTNCDRMGIAGGEPLLYPDIVEVVDFISYHEMKPMLLTNGEVCIGTGTRNEPGRMGSREAHIYIAGAPVVAASAITGRITDPSEIVGGDFK